MNVSSTFIAPSIPTPQWDNPAQINRCKRTPPYWAKLRTAVTARIETTDKSPGSITLVGVGPGHSQYLTQGAECAIRGADAILYDRLIDEEILCLVRAEALLESVGKQGFVTGSDAVKSSKQGAINSRMVELALQGLHVVRVKGGDASIFGRVADELGAARAVGVEVRVEPGVTTASVVAARLQFPLTAGRGLVLVSAHEGADWIQPDLVLHATLAVYMGLRQLAVLLAKLTAGGEQCSSVPVVAVQSAGTPCEKVVFATVGTLSTAIQESELQSPTIVIMGEAVRLARDWPSELD